MYITYFTTLLLRLARPDRHQHLLCFDQLWRIGFDLIVLLGAFLERKFKLLEEEEG